MVRRKGKQTHTATAASDNASDASHAGRPSLAAAKPPQGFFPFARYTSVVGVHASLLIFSALFLPQLPVSAASSPTATLTSICAGAVLLQGWWGGWMRKWWLDYSLEGNDDEKVMQRTRVNATKVQECVKAWIATLVSSFAIHSIIILFGAPATTYIPHTYLLASLVSVLTVFAPVYTLGVPSLSGDTAALIKRLTYTRLFVESSTRVPVERALVYPVLGTVIGCWAGAFPIPLDWEEPWQAWPLTPAFGAIFGYVAGSLGALTVSSTLFFANVHVESQAEKAAQLASTPKSKKKN
ncbi:hypothetical protein PLICRDRAFT_173632 [Plicaturopsis crispa FD-325 SS-3]|nr:hypothetical protein PLICRDRAFT_173632 [Plicaturopsis crispa FD-325 SS-3]